MNKDLKNACRSTRDMDEYLEVRSSQEIIDDIKESAGQETLRDQFAMQALAAMGTWVPPYTAALGGVINQDEVRKARAEFAYAQADAMIAARSISPAQCGGDQ